MPGPALSKPPESEGKPVSRFWSRHVSELQPYVPGEQPKLANLVKLNTNENPFGPSPQVLAAIAAELNETLRLYPDPESVTLRRTVADYYGLVPGQVFVGNGSDEVLAHVFHGLLKQSRPLLFPDITYSFYPVYSQLYGIEYEQIPLADDLNIDLADYRRPNGGILFPNPNAPTGYLLPLEAIEALLVDQPDSLVVVDEAYIDFGGESAAALVNRYDNLLVIQTLSKSRSLAGLRVGLALGHSALIDALVRVKNSFNSYPLDRLAQAGAVAAFEDRAWFEQTCQAVIAGRERLTAGLQSLAFEVLPSGANFVFARHGSFDAAELTAQLRERGIIVRHFAVPRIDQFMRITVGTEEQVATFLAAVAELVGR